MGNNYWANYKLQILLGAFHKKYSQYQNFQCYPSALIACIPGTLQVIDALMATGPLLALGRPISTPFEHIRAFEQDNSKSSRKKLLPVIERFLRDLKSQENCTPTSPGETPLTVQTGTGLRGDLTDVSSAQRDDSAISGDVGSGAVDRECRSQTGGDVCGVETHNVITHLGLISCDGETIQDAVTTNVVAKMIAADMERLKSHECNGTSAGDVNVVAGKIAAEMESTRIEVTTRLVTEAGDNMVAPRIAAKMQLQEDRRRLDERDSTQLEERTVSPSQGHKPCHRPGVLVSRGGDGTRSKKKLRVRLSDTDRTVSSDTDSCGEHVRLEDKVQAAADHVVTVAVNSAIDLYLDSSTQVSCWTYSHLPYIQRENVAKYLCI